MIVTTTPSVEDKKILEYKGIPRNAGVVQAQRAAAAAAALYDPVDGDTDTGL